MSDLSSCVCNSACWRSDSARLRAFCRLERSAADVVATWAGMAVIVVGLAGMAVRVARAAPEVETGPAEG